MKNYQIHFQIKVHDKATTYPEVCPIDLSLTENLPTNVDPHKYLRQRISEELTRNFAALSIPIENKTDDAPEEDALG